MIIVKRNIKTVKNTQYESIERHPVSVLGTDYKVKIIYKNIKIAELNVEDKTIKISLPNKYKKISSKNILDMAIDKMYEQIAIVEIERAMEKTRIMLGFAPEDYTIEKIENKLAKCEDNIITINPLVAMYSREIIDYIVLHEYCHLKYKTHSKKFMEILKKCDLNYHIYEEMLKQKI